MPPLPAPLAEMLDGGGTRLPKRERTRRQLVDAAIQVFSARGVGPATIHEIATVAGMANGTVYNHFATKEVLVEAVAVWIAETLCRRISATTEDLPDAAQRMAVGNRRYLWFAQTSPVWTRLMLDVGFASPTLFQVIREFPLADVRLGVRQKRFRIASEDAAIDLIQGTVGQAMIRIAMGQAPARHDIAVATTVLRGLGMDTDEAAEIAKRPLPAFATATR